MVATELNRRHHVTVAAAAVIGVTLASSLVAVLDPKVAGPTPPHPTLTGSLNDWLDITAENLRVLAAPFLLWILGADKSRLGRRAGDVVVLAVTAFNAILVGIALGRWQSRLIPYLPQLPLEWAALILAVSAWLTIRTTTATRHQIAVLAASTAVLVVAAAALETWATPHQSAPVPPAERRSTPFTVDPCRVGNRGLTAPRIMRRLGRVAARSSRSLPLTPLGSARPNTGADRATSTTPGPPQGGTTT